MKKITGVLLVLLFIFSTIGLKAQHDVRLNILGAFFKNYGIGYEYLINDEMGAGISVNYATSFLGIDGDGNFSSFNVAPEFRFYFNPEDGADGFYFGGYLKYAKVDFKGLSANIGTGTFDTWGNEIYADLPYDVNLNGFAFGIQSGKKWVTNSGFFFETNFGFGRYLTKSVSYTNSAVETYYDRTGNTGDEDALNWMYTFDWRFAINIGYRFGQ